MVRSSSRTTLAAGLSSAALLALVAACNSVLGLGDYDKVACDKNECEGGLPDAGPEADAPAPPDASPDVSIDVEAGTYDPARAWASWPMPNPVNDAGYPYPASYDAGGDAGTVYDSVTHLQWENITTLATGQTVAEAQVHCAQLVGMSFAGATDWRLPTRIELASLIDYTRSGPTIDPVFASTPNESFWTSSPVAGSTALNWTIHFGTGVVTNTPQGSSRVRCVRGGKT